VRLAAEIVEYQDSRIFRVQLYGFGRDAALFDDYFLILIAAGSDEPFIGLIGKHHKHGRYDDSGNYP
jgi:hypothetical protein